MLAMTGLELKENRTWTSEQVELLTQLWMKGDNPSARSVALEINKTFHTIYSRAAVLGKIFRIGLVGRRASGINQGYAPDTPRKRIRKPRRRLFPTDAVYLAALKENECTAICGPLVSLMELTSKNCHWPIGDPKNPDFAFCGAATQHGPYCSGHKRMAYEPRTRR